MMMKQQKKLKKSADKKKNKFTPKDKPAWMKVPPKPGEANTKTSDSKMYNWCKHHKAWVMHKPEACRIANAKGNDKKSPHKDPATPDKEEKRLALAAQLAALTEDSDDE